MGHMFKILLASLCIIISRLLPHPFNFSPVISLALVCPLLMSSRRDALIALALGMALSDCLLGFYSSMPFVYGSLLLIALLGHALKEKLSFFTLSLTGFSACLTFFLITNFGCWLTMPIYPKTLAGLVTCFSAALPFFQNTLLATGFYLLFFYLVKKQAQGTRRKVQVKQPLQTITPN